MATIGTERDVLALLKTSQQKAVSTGALTVALLAVLAWGSLRPTVNTILEANRKYEVKTVYLNNLKDQNAKITQLITQEQELTPTLSRLRFYFPADGDYSLFIQNLNEIAIKHNLVLNSVTFSENSTRRVEAVSALQFDQLNPTTFQVSVQGDPNRLSSFLAYLEDTPFLPKVITLSYSPNKSDPSKTTMSIVCLLYKLNVPLPE